MSSETDLFKPQGNHLIKGVGGTMTGTVKNLSTGIVYDFSSGWVWRDELDRTLRFLGNVENFQEDGREVFVCLQLSNPSQTSDRFEVGDKRIRELFFAKFKPNTKYDADSGYATLERDANDQINGKLVFTTVSRGEDRYALDMEFDIGKLKV